MKIVLVACLVLSMLNVWASGLISCTILTAQPACNVIVLPGPAIDVGGLVIVDGVGGSRVAGTGELLVATVAVDSDVSATEWARAAIDGRRELATKSVVLQTEEHPDGQPVFQGDVEMTSSQVSAALAAFSATGQTVFVRDGLAIHEVTAWRNDDVLRAGDVLLTVDGNRLTTSADLGRAIAGRVVGDQVTVQVRAAWGEIRTIEVPLVAGPDGTAVIGVVVSTDLDLPIPVSFQQRGISGPSAGLIFAIAIAQGIEGTDLTAGEVIAGTGIVSADGRVLPIGAIRQKVVSVTEIRTQEGKAPATVMLVPEANLDEAASAPVAVPILLIPVATVADAVSALKDLQNGVVTDAAIQLVP